MEDSRDTGLQDLLKKAADDGKHWLDAEFALARAQTGSVVTRLVIAVVMAFTALVCLFMALVALTYAAILFLNPYVGSFLIAALIVGAILVALTAILGFAAWARIKSSTRVLTFFERWMP
jgi:hypothetical protein